jgi:hypothetical protein
MGTKMAVLGTLNHVVWWILTDVSEMLTASIIRAIAHSPNNGDNKNL